MQQHEQQVELLREQNRVNEERITYLKDMERKLKQLQVAWKKEANKSKVMKEMEALLFRRDEKKVTSRIQKKVDSRYKEIGGTVKPGDKVKVKKSHQVGEVMELRGKRAIVRIGLLPMQVSLDDLVVVQEK